MLFSDPRVSAFVREHFVAAWESVRPVPTVEIDFGDGRKLKRTVNGNIATYICAADGRVIDVIPGLNTAEAYLAELRAGLQLHRASRSDFEKTILGYHASKSMGSPRRQADPLPSIPARGDVGKGRVEAPIKRVSLDEARVLAADTEFNRKERKPLLHKILSERIWRPGEITKRVYQEALHCDLDDPYLGLISGAFNGGAYEGR